MLLPVVGQRKLTALEYSPVEYVLTKFRENRSSGSQTEIGGFTDKLSKSDDLISCVRSNVSWQLSKLCHSTVESYLS